MSRKPDFSGWATKANLECSDGLTIVKDAFKADDGKTVPIVWTHDHEDMSHVLGHAKLENKEDGVYAYGYLNGTPNGRIAKSLVQNGDINAMSIFATDCDIDKSGSVSHGEIREVSLVVAGANPGAKIDAVLAHAEGETPSIQVFTGETILVPKDSEMSAEDILKAAGLNKQEDEAEEPEDTDAPAEPEEVPTDDGTTSEDENPEEDEKEKKKEAEHSVKKSEVKKVRTNIFENPKSAEKIESAKIEGFKHAVLADVNSGISLKKSMIAHANDYGIKNIDVLFPDAKAVRQTPDFVKRETAWVQAVIGGTSHSPFARIKSLTADITEDEARAKGYIKGNQKVSEFFSVAQRTTNPTTIYKLQKLSRDDIIDITNFDVVTWLFSEMRLMLDEEIARAILIGDGRVAGSTDKVKEDCIRPIYNDADLYTVKVDLTAKDWGTAAEEIAKSKVKYRGTGTPVLFTTSAVHMNLLWTKDSTGRRIYDSDDILCAALGVSKIVDVDLIENLKLNNKNVLGIYVNLSDYTVGTDRGGAITSFDDFDIDFNQYRYLLETRMSGALTLPYSAVTITSATLSNTAVSTASTNS